MKMRCEMLWKNNANHEMRRRNTACTITIAIERKTKDIQIGSGFKRLVFGLNVIFRVYSETKISKSKAAPI